MLNKIFIPIIIAGALLTGNAMADHVQIPVTFVIGNFSKYQATISKKNPIEVGGQKILNETDIKIPGYTQLVCTARINASVFKTGSSVNASVYYGKHSYTTKPSNTTKYKTDVTDGAQTVLLIIKKDPIKHKDSIHNATKRPRFSIEMSDTPYSVSGGKKVNNSCYQAPIGAQ